MKFGVVFFDALRLFKRASCRADAETQIPQRPRKLGDQRPEFLLGALAPKQKKNVEVGIGEKHAPPVAAERQQAKSLWFAILHAQNFAENLPDMMVRQFADRVQRVSRTRAGFKLLPDFLPFRVGLRAEHGQGRRRLLHVLS